MAGWFGADVRREGFWDNDDDDGIPIGVIRGKPALALLVLGAVVLVILYARAGREASGPLKDAVRQHLGTEYAGRVLHRAGEGHDRAALEAKAEGVLRALREVSWRSFSVRSLDGYDWHVRVEPLLGGEGPPDERRVRYLLFRRNGAGEWFFYEEETVLDYWLAF